MTQASEAHSIVIVDDVPEIREILGFLLEESGWFRVVGEAGDGDEAIEVAARERPDLLLLDIDLAGSSGWDVLPALRERAPTTAVVVLSGSVEVEPAHREVVALASAVLEKGRSNRDLINSLLAVVGRSRFGTAEHIDRTHAGAKHFEVADAESWLDAVVAASSDAIIGTTLDGQILTWNDAAERLYGYTAAETVGRPIRMLFPADRPDEESALPDIVAGGRRVEAYETVRVHKDGSRVDVQLTAAPVVDESGEVIAAATISRNISGRRQTEAALARAMVQLEHRNRELTRSNEELDSFAAVASHDLAQPLQVAYGFLDMLRSDYGTNLPERGQEWLDKSLQSLERMRNLVRDILRYARSGSGEPKVEAVALDEVVADAVASLEVAISERSAEVDVPIAMPVVLADRGQLTLVLQNLIGNAIKFVPASRAPVVRVAAEGGDREVVVRISDNGVGIDPHQRIKVFEMFQRGAGTAPFAGTGLGLAIVKKIVGRHRGAVWIEDGLPVATGAPTFGTTVAVRLPAP